MAGSQETFGKKEREKKRLKKKKDKLLRKEERKAGGQDSMFVYVDEFGQLTDTPPDPTKKIKVDASTIEIGIPKKEDRAVEELKAQAKRIADEMKEQGVEQEGLADKEIVALIAYLQRLGTDIKPK